VRAGGFVRGAAGASAGNISHRKVRSASLQPSDARVGTRETHKQSSKVFRGLFLLGRTAQLRPLSTILHLYPLHKVTLCAPWGLVSKRTENNDLAPTQERTEVIISTLTLS
jgi:hypothetical protein